MSLQQSLQHFLHEFDTDFQAVVDNLLGDSVLKRAKLRFAYKKLKEVVEKEKNSLLKYERSTRTGGSRPSVKSSPRFAESNGRFKASFEISDRVGHYDRHCRRLNFEEISQNSLSKISEFSFPVPSAKFSKVPRLPHPCIIDTPGPGAYRVSLRLTKPNSPSPRFVKTYRKASDYHEELPGPGVYSPTIHAISKG